MSSSRANPLRGIIDVVSEMDRMRQLGRTGRDPATEHPARTPTSPWVPAADIYAIGSDLVIRVELPGVDPADLELEMTERVLTISGERRTEPDGAATFYTRERDDGPFRRRMILPDDVDEDRISATFDHGLVEITIPGAVPSSVTHSRRIPIQEQAGRQGDPPGRGGPQR